MEKAFSDTWHASTFHPHQAGSVSSVRSVERDRDDRREPVRADPSRMRSEGTHLKERNFTFLQSSSLALCPMCDSRVVNGRLIFIVLAAQDAWMVGIEKRKVAPLLRSTRFSRLILFIASLIIDQALTHSETLSMKIINKWIGRRKARISVGGWVDWMWKQSPYEANYSSLFTTWGDKINMNNHFSCFLLSSIFSCFRSGLAVRTRARGESGGSNEWIHGTKRENVAWANNGVKSCT